MQSASGKNRFEDAVAGENEERGGRKRGKKGASTKWHCWMDEQCCEQWQWGEINWQKQRAGSQNDTFLPVIAKLNSTPTDPLKRSREILLNKERGKYVGGLSSN